MKKKIKIILVIMLSILLVGCKSKEGYQLIEITGQDLIEALNNREEILYATIYMDSKTGENFKRDLSRIAKEKHTDIYYVDSSKMSFWDDETIYIINNIDTRKNYIYYTGKNEIALEYKDYKDLNQNLEGYKSNKIGKITSDEEKQKYLKDAKTAYEEGRISDSYNLLTKCWTLDEAKEYYSKGKYYKLFNEWEYRAQNNKELTIKKITIFDVTSLLFTYEYKGPVADYKEPKAKEYNDVNFRVKDDIIYVEVENDFQPKYKIISLEDEELILEENKVQTVYKANKKEN